MPESRGGISLDDKKKDKCFCRWGIHDCPNDYEYVIESLGRIGYSKMCSEHYKGYVKWNAGGFWRAWTRKNWENSNREQELENIISKGE